MNYHKNLETIARGKGSPQARYHDEECEICDEDEIRDGRPLTWTTGGGHKEMKKCSCGTEITEEQDRENIKFAEDSRTSKLDMCGVCWIDYLHHAETGE